MSKLIIPAALQKFTDGQTELNYSGASLRDLAAEIKVLAPELYNVIYHDDKLSGFVNFFQDGKLLKQDVNINIDADIELLAAISGG